MRDTRQRYTSTDVTSVVSGEGNRRAVVLYGVERVHVVFTGVVRKVDHNASPADVREVVVEATQYSSHL
ncbi:hypothetical protein D3C87_2091050 [compost metagenome]